MKPSDPAAQKPAQINHLPIVGVNKVIAIASGKGGVGKSTTTVMIAHTLKAAGRKTAILDADIYGPSIPLMLGLAAHAQPELTANGLMIPPVGHGIACNSMGFLVPQDVATVWRAPMITKALAKLARGTQWSAIAPQAQDATLLADFPPGTGDIQLSMAQQVPMTGAIIVTTPQAVAVADARKAADMFRKLKVPILGIIENMSWFEDATGARHYLFGKDGGRLLADEIGVPLLAQIPQLPALIEAMDHGALPDAGLVSYYNSVATIL